MFAWSVYKKLFEICAPFSPEFPARKQKRTELCAESKLLISIVQRIAATLEVRNLD